MDLTKWLDVPHALENVLHEVAEERARQDAKWGEQNWPDGTNRHRWVGANAARTHCEKMAAAGVVTWFDIMQEEVWEAYAEEDPVTLRAELVQVAAVAVNWIEAIDRRLVNE